MSFLKRIFSDRRRDESLAPLYAAIVERGRDPCWYRDGGVPDSIDGRFDMIAALLALVLLRLEAAGEETRRASILLTERFIDDMEGTVRQMGIGDQVVGKHVGKMMGALGGRLGAFRGAAPGSEAFEAAVRRNIFHEAPPCGSTLAFVTDRLSDLARRLAAAPVPALLEGRMP